MKNDAKIMANLLRTGYKMLNKSCPVCNNPIFQDKKNKMFCPICNREVIIVNNENFTVKTKIDDENLVLQSSNNYDGLMLLKENIIEKIKFLTPLLSAEEKVDSIDKYTIILLKLLKLLRYIKLIIEDHKK